MTKNWLYSQFNPKPLSSTECRTGTVDVDGFVLEFGLPFDRPCQKI